MHSVQPLRDEELEEFDQEVCFSCKRWGKTAPPHQQELLQDTFLIHAHAVTIALAYEYLERLQRLQFM